MFLVDKCPPVEEPDAFYNQPNFGIFGWNWKVLEEQSISLLNDVMHTRLSRKAPPVFGVSVRDLNPHVFGEKGDLRKFLERHAGEHPGSVFVFSKEDTLNVLSDADTFINYCRLSPGDLFTQNPCLGRTKIPSWFNTDRYEFVFADREKESFLKGGRLALSLYDREGEDSTRTYLAYPHSVYWNEDIMMPGEAARKISKRLSESS